MAHPDPFAALKPFASYAGAPPTRPAPTFDLVRAHRTALLAVARDAGATNVRIVGSVARGDARAGSDVDFLVSLPPEHTLLDVGGLYAHFEAVLGVPVDVLVEDAVPAAWREAMQRDAVPL